VRSLPDAQRGSVRSLADQHAGRITRKTVTLAQEVVAEVEHGPIPDEASRRIDEEMRQIEE